jgi:hypothetical protein
LAHQCERAAILSNAAFDTVTGAQTAATAPKKRPTELYGHTTAARRLAMKSGTARLNRPQEPAEA